MLDGDLVKTKRKVLIQITNKILFMKTALLITIIFFNAASLWAQSDLVKYPEPEFSNEVYYLKKDTTRSAIRLEKESSQMEAKLKFGGLGGMENGYTINDIKSKVRIGSGNNLSFVFSTGASVKVTSPSSDSLMNANGMDPNMQNMMSGINNPLDNIILYKLESEKGKRKILLQKSGGAFIPNSKKIKTSEKYTFGIKKIREGYTELVIDKTLPAGEYAFSMMNLGMGATGGDMTLFAFGIDKADF
jgi:hypothetical protein